ncbi:MAG: hypothetical protein ACKVU0_17940, partial [Saprospiraceae bacterium]
MNSSAGIAGFIQAGRWLLLFLGLFCMGSTSVATHLMGGDFTYSYVSKSGGFVTYKVSMKLYRDCNSNTQFPSSATVGAYYANNNSSYGTLTLSKASGYSTEKSITPKCLPSSTICIAEMLYEGTVQLPASNTTGFYFSAGSCCRNNGITNIYTSSNNVGMGWLLYVPPPQTYTNTSVNFANLPVPTICLCDTISFNHNAYDANGDSLVYSLATPYSSSGGMGGITQQTPPPGVVSYNSGYSLAYPLDTSNYISINPETGEIKTYICDQGLYVISVEVKEYRKLANGSSVYVGSVRRDLQLIAKSCTNYSPPKFKLSTGYNDSNYYNRTIAAGDTLKINITGVDTLGDSLYISANGAIFTGVDGQCSPFATMPADTADSTITTQFKWGPGCCRVGQTYVFTVDLSDNNCGTTQKTFSIKVSPMATLPKIDIRCVDVVSNSKVKLTWNPSGTTKNFGKYLIYRRTGTTGSFTKIDSVITVSTTSWTDNNATNAESTKYQYMMRVANLCDSLGPTDTITVVQASVSKTVTWRADFKWNKPTWGVGIKYFIYRNDPVNGGFMLLDSTRDTTYYVYAKKCQDSVSYRVVAVDSLGNCSGWSTISSKVLVEDVIAPVIMGYYRATINSGMKVQLDWKPNDSLDVKWYYLYKFDGTNFNLIDSVAANGSLKYSYVDNTV